ncbi:YigZ family protein [Bacteroidales bacterium]
MTDDTYNIITASGEGLYKEKGSKFIAIALAVQSEDEIREVLLQIKKKHFDARHHCYAWVLGTDKSQFRANDDGEPSGSAGKPILNQIYSADLTNILVIVVRYFGGIKLGVSGLVNAYKTAAREAIAHAPRQERTVDNVYLLKFEYPLINEVMRVLREEDIQPATSRFELSCEIEFFCRISLCDNVLKKLKKIFGVEIIFIKTI